MRSTITSRRLRETAGDSLALRNLSWIYSPGLILNALRPCSAPSACGRMKRKRHEIYDDDSVQCVPVPNEVQARLHDEAVACVHAWRVSLSQDRHDGRRW